MKDAQRRQRWRDRSFFRRLLGIQRDTSQSIPALTDSTEIDGSSTDRSLNFTRAAEQCNVTQPALTKAIQKLESELDGLLIHRERHLTQLTDLGKLVLPSLERVYVASESVRASAEEFQRRKVAPLQIALASCISASILEAALIEVAKFVPELQVELVEGKPAEIDDMLLSGVVSAAIIGDDAERPSQRIDDWPLFEEQLMVLMPKESRFSERSALSAELLAEATWIGRTGFHAGCRCWRELFPEGGEPKIGHRGHHLSQLQHMVSAGLGLTLWPEHAPHLDTLVVRAIEGYFLRRTVELRVVQGRRYSPALEAFVKVARVLDWTKSFPKREEPSRDCERHPRHISASADAPEPTGRSDINSNSASSGVSGSYRTAV
jgi:DNA-binding transcriptional LysR family regulator